MDIDLGVLTHAIQVLNHPSDRVTLLSFADHLRESIHGEDPWAEALLLYLRGKPLPLFALAETVHRPTSAEVRGESVLYLPAFSFAAIWVGRCCVHSWLPEYRYSYERNEWVRAVPIVVNRKGTERRRPSSYLRWPETKPSVDEVAKELFEFGGIGNLVHAVVGSHYFSDLGNR